MFLYVGAFTGGFMGGEPADGISVFQVDSAAPQAPARHVQTLDGLTSPSFLARHPTLPVLYAVEREWPERAPSGALTTLAVDERSGRLSLVSRQPSGGERPNHVSVHPDGRTALVTNPGTARVAAFPLGDHGVAGPHVSRAQHTGRGPEPRRQANAYPHCVLADATGRRIFVCDLGIDRLMVYDLADGQLTPGPQPFAQVSSGAGPRHLAVHPSGRWVYVINELDATVSAFNYEADTGRLWILQTISCWPAQSAAEHKSGAEVIIHPNGRFLYTTQRRDDSIGVFAITDSGELQLQGHVPSEGQTPRHLAFTPTGDGLYVANQHAGTIVHFTVDPHTGQPSPAGAAIRTPSPVCVLCWG